MQRRRKKKKKKRKRKSIEFFYHNYTNKYNIIYFILNFNKYNNNNIIHFKFKFQ